MRALLSRARRASYGCSYSRSQIFSACGCFAQPPFSFPVQEILGQCYTNLACEFDQTIIFRPTTPPIKRKNKNKVWLARLDWSENQLCPQNLPVLMEPLNMDSLNKDTSSEGACASLSEGSTSEPHNSAFGTQHPCREKHFQLLTLQREQPYTHQK